MNTITNAMSTIAYAEMNFVSLSLCIIIYFLQKNHRTRIIEKATFNRILCYTSVILVLDSISWIILGCTQPGTPDRAAQIMHSLTLAAYFFMQCYLPMVLLRYCITASGAKIGRFWVLWLTLPLAVTVAQLVCNSFGNFAYTVLPDGSCTLESGFIFLAMWPLLYMLASAVTCLVYYIHASDSRKLVAKQLLVFSTVALCGVAVGTFVHGFRAWPVLAVDIAYLYMAVQIQKNDEAKRKAHIDSLTGLQNAMAYREHLTDIDTKIHSGDASFAVVVMDVTGLKEINDHHGHILGDALLIQAAGFISSVFGYERVYRIGGDEFVAVLDDTDAHRCRSLKRAFTTGLARLRVNSEQLSIPVVIAIGSAVYKREKEMLYADVFKLADRRMYEHKKLQKQKCSPISPDTE